MKDNAVKLFRSTAQLLKKYYNGIHLLNCSSFLTSSKCEFYYLDVIGEGVLPASGLAQLRFGFCFNQRRMYGFFSQIGEGTVTDSVLYKIGIHTSSQTETPTVQCIRIVRYLLGTDLRSLL